MGKPVPLDGVAKRGDYMVLTEDIGKGSRAVFSGKNLITHAINLVVRKNLSMQI